MPQFLTNQTSADAGPASAALTAGIFQVSLGYLVHWTRTTAAAPRHLYRFCDDQKLLIIHFCPPTVHCRSLKTWIFNNIRACRVSVIYVFISAVVDEYLHLPRPQSADIYTFHMFNTPASVVQSIYHEFFWPDVHNASYYLLLVRAYAVNRAPAN